MRATTRRYRDQLSLKAKLEAKRRPHLAERDLAALKERCGLANTVADAQVWAMHARNNM